MDKSNAKLKELLNTICIRIRNSARSANKEGDTRREVALLRILIDLQTVIGGHNVDGLSDY